MHGIDALRRDIRELSDQRDKLDVEAADLRTEYRKLEQRRREIVKRQEAITDERPLIDQRIAVSEQALALLEERMPTDLVPVAPEAPAPITEPEPEPAVESPATVEEQPKPKRGGSGRYSKDPLRVNSRQGGETKQYSSGVTRPARFDSTELPPRLQDPTPTQLTRADLVYELLDERGAMSQVAIAAALLDLLDGCTPVSAQTIASESVGLLQHQRRILWTGEKHPARPGGRRVSPVWKIRETPQERASAGLPDDPEANPETTRPYTDTKGQHIVVDSGGFESKRDKH